MNYQAVRIGWEGAFLPWKKLEASIATLMV